MTLPLADERLQLRRNPWPSRTRLPPPEQAAALTMPTHQCRWLHEDEGLAPLEEAAAPDPRNLRMALGARPGSG